MLSALFRTFPWSLFPSSELQTDNPTHCLYQVALPTSLFSLLGHTSCCIRGRENIQLIVKWVYSNSSQLQSTFLIVSLWWQTLQFLTAHCCTQVGVLLQQTWTITAAAVRGRGKEVGGRIARGAVQCEWSSHPWGNDGASSLTTNTSPPLVAKQKPHMQTTGKRRTKKGKTNKSSHTRHPHTHTRTQQRNIPDGTRSALKPDRHATETRLIQMISQLCCHIRE